MARPKKLQRPKPPAAREAMARLVAAVWDRAVAIVAVAIVVVVAAIAAAEEVAEEDREVDAVAAARAAARVACSGTPPPASGTT